MQVELHMAYPWHKEVIQMNRPRILGMALLLVTLASVIPSTARTQDEPFKWYGVGGEFNGARRWLGRFGITENVGAEAIFGVDWRSGGPKFFDLGAGVIYDYAPTAEISPYAMCRFILHIEDNGEYDSDGRIEVGGGAEYIFIKRIGISAELNFGIGLDPSRVMTTTLVRAYFYL
jgi:hypothetical protein